MLAYGLSARAERYGRLMVNSRAGDHQSGPQAPLPPPEPSPPQKKIAEASADARSIVQAGPGTGKTETVVYRLLNLLKQGLRPAQILVLSFSRSAVRTLTARIERRQSTTHGALIEELRYVSIRTFDSWSFRTLRKLNFAPRDLLQRTHEENIKTLVDLLQGPRGAELTNAFKGIRHVIVDEFQDLSGVRGGLVLEVLALVAPPEKSANGFTVLGDPAQAIYAFSLKNGSPAHAALTSGALIGQIGERYGTSLKKFSLDENFRATDKLGSVAKHLRQFLLCQESGKTKLESMRKFISRVRVTANGLKAGSLLNGEMRTAAVLTSTNGEAIRVAQKLMEGDTESDAPVILHGGSQPKYIPPWIGVALGPFPGARLPRSQFRAIHERCFGEKSDGKRAFDVPAEPEAWMQLSRAAETSADATFIDMNVLRERLDWTDSLPDDDAALAPGIHVMTIHQSKGMEFDSVAVLTESLMDRKLETDDQHLEAANVLFVGMTRAARELSQVGAKQIYRPLHLRTNNNGDRRWYLWNAPWINLEMGMSGDLDTRWTVDERLFSEEGQVASTTTVHDCQKFLAENCSALPGHKIILCKWKVPDGGGKDLYRYRIHLKEGDKPGRVLGLTGQRLTRDLLGILYKKGYQLPKNIYNLRISEITTMTAQEEFPTSIARPFADSKLWLGVNFYGCGDFKPWKWKASK